MLLSLLTVLVVEPSSVPAEMLVQVDRRVHSDIFMSSIWVAMAGALVFFMQAGFALIESGMSRVKNSINVMMKNYVDVCLVTLAFWAIGYGIMFGQNPSGWFGESFFFLKDLNQNEYAQAFFQMMFAATAVTVCSGAMAERIKFVAYIVSSILITVIVYAFFGNWAWNAEGWLSRLGFIDFAGSTVVHSIGAWCALAGIVVLGPRLGRFNKKTKAVREIHGHNLSLVALGGFILWFGWFGFNGGSLLSIKGSHLGLVLINTHLAAAAGALGVVILALVERRSVLLTESVNGTLAGLVSITAGCLILEPLFAVLVGFFAGILVVFSQRLLLAMQLDDVVGAVSVHGSAGVWGTIAAGLFMTGDMFNYHQVLIQLLGALVAFVWAFPVAWCIYKLLDLIIGIRSHALHEQRGLDVTEHDEVAYPEFHYAMTHKPIMVKSMD